MKDKGTSKELFEIERELRDMTTKWNTWFGIGSFCYKDIDTIDKIYMGSLD